LLVDSGRATYRWTPLRRHVFSTAAHNALLIDGQGQAPFDEERDRPIPDSHWSIDSHEVRVHGTHVWSELDHEHEPTVHHRCVVYRPGEFWLVIDEVRSDQPRTIEALWHFHPECTVEADGASAHTTDADAVNVRVAPIGDTPWRLELARGTQDEQNPNDPSAIRGWYSPRYNTVMPTTVARFHGQIDDTATFAWLITTAHGPAAELRDASLRREGQTVRVKMTLDGQTHDVTVPLRVDETSP